jgi:ppGpp synthetase/RelA/SpoT-type nucleotidyltranferase
LGVGEALVTTSRRATNFGKKYKDLSAANDLRALAPDFDEKKNKFKEYYGTELPRLQAAEKAFRGLVHLLVSTGDFPEPKVLSRIKDRNECIEKFNNKYRDEIEKTAIDYSIQNHISDLIGIRVICIYEKDILEVEKILLSNFDLIEKTDKSSQIEIDDNKFGYKGVHLDLKLNKDRNALPENKLFSDQRFEVQIRSIAQDAWSEVDHKLKYKRNIPNALKRRINCLAALFELADKEFMAIQAAITEHERAAQENLKLATQDDPKLSVTDISLDAFSFLAFMRSFDERYEFDPIKADEFVGVMQSFKEDITLKYIQDAVAAHGDDVREYRKVLRERVISLNPYTHIRHILYANDPGTFSEMIYPNNRASFDKWLDS